jgi:circadian clock protein KaiC
VKFRGRRFRGGYHDYEIVRGGLTVFPRLVAAEHRTASERVRLASGIAELDTLLGGGIESGSSTLIVGAAGAGKSSLAAQFAAAAADRGQRTAMFIFDESLDTLLTRAAGLGIQLQKHLDSGTIAIRSVDPAELSPGEFAHRVGQCVQNNGVRTVIIDSLNGYQMAMPEEQSLILHMHELLQYLNRLGTATFVTVAQHGVVGDMKTPVDVTYLADTVILLRFFEAEGRVRRATSVIKKRTGWHEDTIREMKITSHGLVLGDPLDEFHGVLRGVPTYVGKPKPSPQEA